MLQLQTCFSGIYDCSFAMMITGPIDKSRNDQEETANLFQKYNYTSLPVVDDFGKLVDRVTSDDVLDVIQERRRKTSPMVAISGDEQVFTPWPRSVRNRLPWLCINLATGFCMPGSFHVQTSHRYAVSILPSHRRTPGATEIRP